MQKYKTPMSLYQSSIDEGTDSGPRRPLVVVELLVHEKDQCNLFLLNPSPRSYDVVDVLVLLNCGSLAEMTLFLICL